MNKNINFFYSLLIGLIVLAVTFIIFFLGVDNKSSLDWVSLAFVLIAEIALFGGITLLAIQPSSSRQIILRTGIISVFSMYWLFTLLIGLFRNIFKDYTNIFYMINIGIIGMVAVVSILIYRVSLGSKEE
ncbi:hypothetical protein Desde_0582 [Desulfitobacterium dehalogenans ATCC 51507]|uniref:Uncharacterized protein n=1 Tax=Desulfitobacterium dehalogenans (strain ATCC 51507 / DSM 9161 / JW/IU-DC1) TaxID=756499 RepID=I4A501_DESDJ|nr:hypothetical protein [Desulfitobacterium dehalogenans]AFL99035.1 hypothetical protein Desde_0582 [Desulfitobacterium dehalogenans ATCC 51507]